MFVCVCVVPRGFLAAAVVTVRVAAVVRTDVAVLLAAVVAVPFLVAAVEPVEVAALAFGTRGRLSVIVWGERGREINSGDVR